LSYTGLNPKGAKKPVLRVNFMIMMFGVKFFHEKFFHLIILEVSYSKFKGISEKYKMKI